MKAHLFLVYFIGSVQQTAFDFNGVRLSGLDRLFVHLCFLLLLLLCFTWSFMSVRNAEFCIDMSFVVLCSSLFFDLF